MSVLGAISGFLFLLGLVAAIFWIAFDPRRVFWRDSRRRDNRGSHLPIRFFWW